jgi:hypothetical protein
MKTKTRKRIVQLTDPDLPAMKAPFLLGRVWALVLIIICLQRAAWTAPLTVKLVRDIHPGADPDGSLLDHLTASSLSGLAGKILKIF